MITLFSVVNALGIHFPKRPKTTQNTLVARRRKNQVFLVVVLYKTSEYPLVVSLCGSSTIN